MEQTALLRALADPRFYPRPPPSVEHVQTHISHVFLAGAHVYKLKKAVRFSFLDASTPERRRHLCEEEVRLNRRLCPDVYLGVVPIARGPGGRLVLGGTGEVVDHVVHTRRLPADRMLGALLAQGAVRPTMLAALARLLADFHARAATGPEVARHAAPDVLAARMRENVEAARPFVGRLLTAAEHGILADFGPSFLRRHEALLRARQQAGRIREGHGDVHAEHVCFVDAPVAGAPGDPALAPGIYVYDCIEFSHALRCNDVASEIAFLAMDLEALGHPALAAEFVARYAAAADDPDVHTLLPLYVYDRACVRGKVEGMASVDPALTPADAVAAAERARRHFRLALRAAWRGAGPALVACAGLSGTGKTTLAEGLAAATGFVHLSTDAIRRRDHPGAAPASIDAGPYEPRARAAVYRTLAVEAERALAAGRGVIADATFIRRADREALAAAAARERRPCVFVECRADPGIVRERLGARANGPALSDARWDTYLVQRVRQEPYGDDEPHFTLDAGAGAAAVRDAALAALWTWREHREAAPVWHVVERGAG
jgi:aminoglycoside phosphotransferase family enzyme/predicted kinase